MVEARRHNLKSSNLRFRCKSTFDERIDGYGAFASHVQHIEEKIKKTVLAHTGSLSGMWQDMIHRMNCESALSIYCNCSVISGKFHIGICIAGDGACRLFGKTLNTQYPELTVLGELKALTFAIECAQEFIIN